MEMISLGKTGIVTAKNAFGALPIQRVSKDEAAYLLQRALDGGMTFFDTARAYSDSEEKIGYALSDRRDHIYIATKTMAQTAETFWDDLHESLRALKTDHIDLYQLHNPPFCPRPGDENGLYDAAQQALREGKILHLGITEHRLTVANEAVDSGLYETLQFPLCYLSAEPDLALARKCQALDVGFIAMKALSGGLITSGAAAFAYLAQFPSVLPIWGIQRRSELEEFLSYQHTPPVLAGALSELIARDRTALTGAFCRGCGYCLPCPVGIEINNCARMSLMVRRSPSASWTNAAGIARMDKIKDCIHCGQCSKRCPYGLETPKLLEENLADFQDILSGKTTV